MQRLLSEVEVKVEVEVEVEVVCPRTEIDLAIELFNLETWNFQKRY